MNPQALWYGIALHGDAPERHRAAARTFPGNFLFSTGPNTQGGGKRNTRGHYDVPMRDCTVELDGKAVIEQRPHRRSKNESQSGGKMKKLLLVIVTLLRAAAAHAADKVKVGFISTLSGPNASIGVDIRDAFNLAIKLNGGKLGGLPAEVLVERRPAQARARQADRRALPAARKGGLRHRHRVLQHRARRGAGRDRRPRRSSSRPTPARRSTPARSATRSSSPRPGRARPTARRPAST